MDKIKECIDSGITCDRSRLGCFNRTLKDQGKCKKCLIQLLEEHDKEVKMKSTSETEKENDYCEWFKYDYRTIAPRYHDVNNPYWRIPENMDKLKYCPYCGKKIRVIG